MSAPPDQQTVASYEYEFVDSFFDSLTGRGDKSERQESAWRVVERVEPEDFSVAPLGIIYGVMRELFVEGAYADATVVWDRLQGQDPVVLDTFSEAIGSGGHWRGLEQRGHLVQRESRRRAFRDLLRKSTDSIETSFGEDGGKKLANALAVRVMEVYGDSRGGGTYQSAPEVVKALRERATSENFSGIPFPWPSLEKHAGPLIPGDECIGITAYSNAGKSTFAANLFWEWVKRGYKCIAFPTEMSLQWIERGVAALSGVDQWRAEKRMWKGDEGRAQQEEYLAQLREIESWGDRFAVVNRADIGPTEIATAVRVLRKRWPDEPVFFFVDHMHRLDYGEKTADEAAGDATKMFRNLAMTDGMLIPVLLFQPRKPHGTGDRYSPIAGQEIRGHSSIWNELSIHLSPYRAFVETWTDRQTTWGTNRTKVDPEGRPKIVKPVKEARADRKLADEHLFAKIDKRRIGGEGPTVVLGFRQPSGAVYDRAAGDEQQAIRLGAGAPA